MISYKQMVNFMFTIPGIGHVCYHRCVKKSLAIKILCTIST